MCFEEMVETDTDEAFMSFKARVGRKPGIPEYLTLCATNPDSPAHWAYDYFINSDLPTRHVYYSQTIDNPFLPSWYLDQLYQDLDEKAFERYGKGRWVELPTDRIYYQYEAERNYRAEEYEVNEMYPIHLCFDFNIGEGKPMSMCLGQFIDMKWHFFGEIIIDGASTEETCEELGSKGFLDYDTDYYIEGDATGASRSTKSKKSDYDIIVKYLANYVGPYGRLKYVKKVPRANPAVRERHNWTNAYCRNKAGQVRFFVYKGCPTLHKGMRLTALKKGGSYIEDDSKPYQHVTTAATYAVHRVHKSLKAGSKVKNERRY
jgi:hypothetical protein